jgi:CRP-like cAMP-binding protein
MRRATTDIHDTLVACCGRSRSCHELWAAHRGAAVRARRHQAVFHADDPSDAFYLLLEGEMRAFVGVRPETRTTLLLRAPAFFGDRDLLAKTPASETYELLTPGRILVWEGTAFTSEYEQHETLRRFVGSDLIRRYVRATLTAMLSVMPLPQRIAHFLGAMARHGAGALPDLAYLARVLDVAERPVSRALTELRRDGILTVNGGDFSVRSDASAETEPARLFHSLAC